MRQCTAVMDQVRIQPQLVDRIEPLSKWQDHNLSSKNLFD